MENQRAALRGINKDTIWQPIVMIDFDFGEDESQDAVYLSSDAEFLDFILMYGVVPSEFDH